MADFHENGVCILIFIFKTPKVTYLRETVSFDVFCVNIGFGPSAAASLKNQKNEHLRVIFHAYGEKKTLVESAQNFALGEISRT